MLLQFNTCFDVMNAYLVINTYDKRRMQTPVSCFLLRFTLQGFNLLVGCFLDEGEASKRNALNPNP